MDNVLNAAVKDKRETQDLQRVTVTLLYETLPADSDSVLIMSRVVKASMAFRLFGTLVNSACSTLSLKVATNH